jgi:hypothetical protein
MSLPQGTYEAREEKMRHGWKIFTLAVLTGLSVMALTVAGVQASKKSGEFRLNGKTFTEAGLTEKAIKFTVGAGGLLSEGLGVNCTGGTGSGVIKKKGATATVEALFTGCTVVQSKFCKVYEGLKIDKEKTTLFGEGNIKASGFGRLLLHEAKHYLLVEGLGANKVISLFDVYGELCPLNSGANPLHVELKGTTVVEQPDALTNQKTHEIRTLDLSTLHTLWTGDPNCEGKLVPQHALILGEKEAHFGTSKEPEAETPVTSTVELTSGESWSSE